MKKSNKSVRRVSEREFKLGARNKIQRMAGAVLGGLGGVSYIE